MEAACFDIDPRSSEIDGSVSPAGWEFPLWEDQKRGVSESAVQGSAVGGYMSIKL